MKTSTRYLTIRPVSQTLAKPLLGTKGVHYLPKSQTLLLDGSACADLAVPENIKPALNAVTYKSLQSGIKNGQFISTVVSVASVNQPTHVINQVVSHAN